MWIVDGELFTNKPEADKRAKELNKTHALVHNEDTDNPPKIYKVSRVIHYEDSELNSLCTRTFGPMTSVFPHMVTCPKCNQLLDQLDND